MAVQELCRDPHGVLAFTRESSGCVWQALHPASRRRLRRHAVGSANWVNVRCDCEGLRRDLKNLSTTVDAESSPLQRHQRTRRRHCLRRSARAGSGPENSTTRQPPPPRICVVSSYLLTW